MADVLKKAKKTKKHRKHGRNASACNAYKLSRQREHNKIDRLKKHLIRFPGDIVALKAVDVAKAAIRGY